MLKINKIISVSGFCTIETEENGNKISKNIAYMNADIPQNGDFSIHKSIQERELFEQNSDEILNDFSKFEKFVYDLAKGMKDE